MEMGALSDSLHGRAFIVWGQWGGIGPSNGPRDGGALFFGVQFWLS